MSLASKVDELRHVAKYANLDLICNTDSWLKSHIHDNEVALDRRATISSQRQNMAVCACISRIR